MPWDLHVHVCVGVYGSAFASFVIKTCKCLCKRICRLLRLLQARCAKCPSDKDHHSTDHKWFSMLLEIIEQTVARNMPHNTSSRPCYLRPAVPGASLSPGRTSAVSIPWRRRPACTDSLRASDAPRGSMESSQMLIRRLAKQSKDLGNIIYAKFTLWVGGDYVCVWLCACWGACQWDPLLPIETVRKFRTSFIQSSPKQWVR